MHPLMHNLLLPAAAVTLR